MLRVLREQKGDTIVEVLIAIIVVSMVLVAAYVTTTKNVDGMQATEEHSEALQLAQSQLEFLHNSSVVPPNHSCFKTDGTITSGLNCLVDPSGTATIVQPQFHIDITKTAASLPNQPTFEIDVTWPSLNQTQTGMDNVSLFYQP